jgi:hypothetical protein
MARESLQDELENLTGDKCWNYLAVVKESLSRKFRLVDLQKEYYTS